MNKDDSSVSPREDLTISEALVQIDAEPFDIAQLGDRAFQILQLAGHGHTDKVIASRLGLQTSTIDWHWRKIRERLGATSRSQAVAKGLVWAYEAERELLIAKQKTLELEIQRREALEADLRNASEEIRKLSERNAEGLAGALSAQTSELLSLRAALAEKDKTKESLEFLKSTWYQMDLNPPHRCLHVSDAFTQYGYEPKDFIQGKFNIVDIIHPEDLGLVISNGPAIVADAPDYVQHIYRMRLANGDYRWQFDRSIVDAPSNSYFGIVIDIHDLVLAGLVAPPENRTWWPKKTT